MTARVGSFPRGGSGSRVDSMVLGNATASGEGWCGDLYGGANWRGGQGASRTMPLPSGSDWLTEVCADQSR